MEPRARRRRRGLDCLDGWTGWTVGHEGSEGGVQGLFWQVIGGLHDVTMHHVEAALG